MQKLDELRLKNVIETAEALILVATDVDLRLKCIELMLWRLDPSLAASCQVDQVSAPLTAESPAPSGAPSDPEILSGSPSDSC